MPAITNIVGKKFGKLTVLSQYWEHCENKKSKKFTDCLCECGNRKNHVLASSLLDGLTKSCGCIRRVNQYRIENDIVFVKDRKGMEFYFSIDQLDKVKDFCWRVTKGGYVLGNIDGKTVSLHRFILNLVDDDSGICVDHINWNPLDNTNENIRLASNGQNMMNKAIRPDNASGVTGVYKYKKEWFASIYINKKRIRKQFKTFHEAVICRLQMEKQYHAEFSSQKHLYEEYGIE